MNTTPQKRTDSVLNQTQEGWDPVFGRDAETVALGLERADRKTDRGLGSRSSVWDDLFSDLQGKDLRFYLERFVRAPQRAWPHVNQVSPVMRELGYSGYEFYQNHQKVADIGFSPLRWGGYTVRLRVWDLPTSVSEPRVERVRWEIFSEQGELQSTAGALHLDLIYVPTIEMNLECPWLSHLYNTLAHEYEQAQSGQSRPKQIQWIEKQIRKNTRLDLLQDLAIHRFWSAAHEVESNQVLNWEERQVILKQIFKDRDLLLRTKKRAHGSRNLRVHLLLKWGDWINRIERVRLRPSSNLRGFVYRYTIGLLIWFFRTVRNNIGYSMALAIYGPFTFYFITQPLNPHAMWAVGKVRSAYLDVAGWSGSVAAFVGGESVAAESGGSASPNGVAVAAEEKNLSSEMPDLSRMPLTTDRKETDSIDWVDRMSQFKNMQIGYEQNLQFAARMGRLEQMELQLNFSMIVDSTWEETERYLDTLHSFLERTPSFKPEWRDYFEKEVARTRQIELYIWDRLLRYILDHPYVVLDQSQEQVYRDYYMGRSILLLRDMTRRLMQRESGMKKPADYKRLEGVAAAFEKTRVEGKTVLDRLKKNSRLFNQNDVHSGNELRGYMKRQWEILYLLQNKAQEASNFGLQTYTWSVRNAIWLLQSLYSAKRRELELYFGNGTQSVEHSTIRMKEIKNEVKTQIEPLYEQLFHMMNLEFASIQPELSTQLPTDVEFKQRRVLIQLVEDFLKDRDRVMIEFLE